MLPQILPPTTPALRRSYQIPQNAPYELTIHFSYRTDFFPSLHQMNRASTAQQGRQPQSDYRMPRDASLDAATNPASDWNPRSSQVIPNSAERSVRINDTPSHTVLR